MTKPLRIGLIMQGDRQWIGGAEYIKNIIMALGSLPPEVRSTFELCLICSKSIEANIYDRISPYLNEIYYLEFDGEPTTLINKIRWRILQKLLILREVGIDSSIRKRNMDFVYPFLAPGRGYTPYKSAAWIADFQHKYLTDYFSSKEIKKRDRDYKHMSLYNSTVVLSSQNAASEFKKFFPEASAKVKVLPFKTVVDVKWYEINPIESQTKYCLPDRFFLVSNQFWQHKNHLLIFKALEILKKRSIYPNVVCTGHIYDYRKLDYSDIILQTIHQSGIARQVYLLGLIPKIDQFQLMRRSLAVIQPSLFEGWSTVVEDARVLGNPMLLSDFPVHIEKNPPNSLFFERHSSEGLASMLADWWERLNPGPDLEQETIARKNNLSEVRAFAESFLEIAINSK